MPAHLARELVITVPLPQDRGRQGDARPKVHRFRSHWLELGRRLRAFRSRYGLTQDEVAAVVGAAEGSAVSQWECGDAVPDGIRRERLIHLLEGRLWPDLRVAALEGDRLPVSWDRGVRWYRRASRERMPRTSVGAVVGSILDQLRDVASQQALRERYCERDGDWVWGVAARQGLGEEHHADLRRIEDAAFGLRWLELAHGLRFDLRGSLVPQLPLALLGAVTADGRTDT